jgi:type VI secretion system protein VasI
MDDLLQQGITAYKAGKRDEARKIFITVVKQSPDSETAWNWMYQASNNDQERIHCLKQILRINPKNEKANGALNQLMNFEPPLQSSTSVTPTSNVQNQVKKIQKIQPSVSKKSSKNLWIIGATFGIGVIVIICVLAISIRLSNQPPLTISAQKPTIAPTKASTPKPFTGKWQTYTKKSEFDGSTTVILGLEAENYVEGWLTTTLPILNLRCKEGKIDTYVNIGMQADVEYGLYDKATVRVRFDQNQAFEMTASESTTGEALFFQDPDGMIMWMLQSREMVLGFTPFNADPVVATFDLLGLTNVIEPLKQSCNWNGKPTIYPTPTSIQTPTPLPSGSAITVSGSAIGKWQIKVEKILLTKSLSTSYGTSSQASGQFALIFLTATNLSASQDIFRGFGKIDVIDDNGIIYEEDVVASPQALDVYGLDNLALYIQPGASLHTIVVFDLPMNSQSYYLIPGGLADNDGQSIVLEIQK